MKVALTLLLLLTCSAGASQLLSERMSADLAFVESRVPSMDAERSADAMLEVLSKLLAPTADAEQSKRISGTVADPGLRISLIDQWPEVQDVLPGSSAEKAGIQPGDRLLELNGHSCKAMPHIDAVDILRGDADDTVAVKVLRQGGEKFDWNLKRNNRQLTALEIHEEFPENISYLRLNGIYSNSYNELTSVLNTENSGEHFGLLLDLRGAGGNSRQDAARLAAVLAPNNAELGNLSDSNGKTTDTFLGNSETQLKQKPFLVLTDGNTCGAAELLAALLKDLPNGNLLVGQPTAGNPLLLSPVKLPSGHALQLPELKLTTAKGRAYRSGDSVEPDINVHQLWDPELYDPLPRDRRPLLKEELTDIALRKRIGGDVILSRATDVLLALQALNSEASARQ